MRSQLIQNSPKSPDQLELERRLIDKARGAAEHGIRPTDEVTVSDGGDRWLVEFVPREDVLGGGVQVAIAKNDLRVLVIIRGQ
jgi:hypothetical protein